VRVRLLGPVDVVVDGEPRPLRGLRRKAVLAVLALHRGAVVSTDRLTETIWGDGPAPIAVNTLQSHVSYLRRVLGDGAVILARPPGYVLELGPESTDVEVAEDRVERATRIADPVQRARDLEAALALWRGRALVDVAGIAWLEEQAQRLDQLWLRATRARTEARLALGDHERLLPDLERLARDNPYDEQLQAQLILALYRTGRQADALGAYQRLRRTLGDDLGIDPTPSLRDLEAAILRHDPALRPSPTPVSAAAPVPAGPSPVRVGWPVAGEVLLGTAALTGRSAELAVLHDAVRAAARGTGGAVFLVGEAGIGKTRLAAECAKVAEDARLSVLRGRTSTPTVQFRPLSEALLSLLRRSGPPDDPRLAPYRPALARIVPEWRGEHPAGGVVSADDSPVVLAEAVLRLLVSLGGSRGCLLVLEDLHDADADTLAVLEYLVDNAGDERVLVLGTTRTEPGPALALVRSAQHRRVASVVELGRLDDEAVRHLAGACLGVEADQVPGPVLDRLVETADGVPLHVEELLAGLVNERILVRADGGWVLTGPVAASLPVSLAATLAARAERLGPEAAAFLDAAALLGRRFPAAAAGAAAGIDGDRLRACLRRAVDAQLLVPGDEIDVYAFRHTLTAEALRARLLPLDRATLARRAAESLDASEPDSRDGTEQLGGDLWNLAGEPVRAAHRWGAAGRRALRQGAVRTSVDLLERALSTVDSGEVELAADLTETLIEAYAEAGRVDDAYALGAGLDRYPEPNRRAATHLRLARVAAAEGDWRQGLIEVSALRGLLAERRDPELAARADAIEAELSFGDQSPDRVDAARQLAERALGTAERNGLPDVACHALETLGRCARLRDLDEADALYRRGLSIAEANQLVGWRITLLFHIGADEGIRRADTDRLTEALELAHRSGAVVTGLDIELEVAVVWLCRGEYEVAAAATRRAEETAARLRLSHTRLIALGERIMVAAHRGQREDVAALSARFRDLGGEESDFSSAVRGFGLAFAHLLHEEGDRALIELDRAVAREVDRPASYVSYIHGPHLLLSVLAGRAGRVECAAIGRSPQAQARWNAQFLALAEALLLGRAGRIGEADRAVQRFLELSRPYPLARHVGLRLAAPAAIAGGWGEPASWLRAADAYFHATAPAVARACRTLLRGTGAPVPQHRRGSEELPAQLRERGITVREYEVLGLVAKRLSNQEMSRRLFLSVRTVEKHVAHLLAKTGSDDRTELAAFAAAATRSSDDPKDG
jgi:DNA-binding SARP family transcriptional activator/DNA-binding CsgD family transcriptional regulator